MATQTKETGNNVAYYHTYEYKALQELKQHGKMHGARRVVMFCLLTAVLPTILLVIPLYLRHSVYKDVTYTVAESDVIEIDDGISTVFCQAHTLKMNSSFHAYQIQGTPKLSPNRKHIRLKKSMILPDDTLEYWGFYLLKGSSVVLSVCSRFQGSSVMVVRGEQNLDTCALFKHKKEDPLPSRMAPGQSQVRVTFETNAQEINPISVKKEESSTPEQPVDEQYEGEDLSEENITVLENFAQEYMKKHFKTDEKVQNESSSLNFTSAEGQNVRHLRHLKHKLHDIEVENHNTELKGDKNDKRRNPKKRNKNLRKRNRKNGITETPISEAKPNNISSSETKNDGLADATIRQKRSPHIGRTHLLDGGVEHGGNANNITIFQDDGESSFSSFENSLMECYKGKILMREEFPPSPTCTDVHALETHGTMEAVHDVVEDGYYFYIFYSDNDYVQNDIHAIFNIHKLTYQYAEHSRSCYNETECTFPITFWSDETVIVEIPTRDGLERDGIDRAMDDINNLISSCNPRMSVYIIFPVAVLFLILGCAFM